MPDDRRQPPRSTLRLELQGGKHTLAVCAPQGLARQCEVGQNHGGGAWNVLRLKLLKYEDHVKKKNLQCTWPDVWYKEGLRGPSDIIEDT